MKLYEPNLDAVMKLTEAQKGYIAGFFDGEGSVSLYYNKKTEIKPLVKVTITQRRPAVLTWIHSVFSGGLKSYSRMARTPEGREYMQNDMYEWSVNGVNGPKFFFKIIRPYLIVKAEEVDEAMFGLEHRDNITREDVMKLKDNIVAIRNGTTG